MVTWLGVLCSVACFAFPDASIIKLMLLHNSYQENNGWREAFYDFFVPWLNGQGGFVMSDGQRYTLDVIVCEEDLTTNATTKVQACVSTAEAQDVDAIIVGTSSENDVVKAAAETFRIPNIHCSGGDPTSWTAATPHAFGMHLPFPWYSRGTIRQAALLGLQSVVILRNYEWRFTRVSAVAAVEWSFQSNLKVIGPTVDWCNRWSGFTDTCFVRNGACQCGAQSEFDALGYKYRVDTMPSFYEISESKVYEIGFNPRAEFLSPAIVEFIEGVVDDVRSQGGDADLVVNFLSAARSGLQAVKNKKFGYKMYFGAPNNPGTAWYGYETKLSNGSHAFGYEAAIYNVGGGQWHHEMGFTDPFFGNSQSMVTTFNLQFGKNPNYDHAACTAAGIAVTYGLQKYGNSLVGMSTAQRREEIRVSVGNLNDETMFGMVNFNRFNQNNGRMTVGWQVLEDGDTRPVLPPEAAATQFRFPSPSWDARLGCPAGTYAAGNLPVPTECMACPEGTSRSVASMGLNFSECQTCSMGFGTLPLQTGLLECPACPAGRYQNGDSDRGVCNECARGTARSANATGGCALCDAETYADAPGLESCKPCPARSSQSDLGQQFCFCDIGSYKDPADATPVGTVSPCLDCGLVLPGSTTLYPSSKYSHECVCPRGTFWHKLSADGAGALCKMCGTGLNCLGGRETATNSSIIPAHQAPVQAIGYAAGAPVYEGGDPAWIVKCGSNLECPGALPLGQCPGGNFGTGCADCLPNYWNEGGLCRSCTGHGNAVPIVVALALLLLLLGGLYILAIQGDMPHRDSIVTLTIIAGLSLGTVQALSAFSSLEVKWIEPVKTLRGFFAFLIFDLDILRPGCFIGNVSPVLNYVASLLVWPTLAGTTIAMFGFAKYINKKDITANQVINTVGLITSAVFIALTALAVRPFQCIQNPDGTSSMAFYRNVICWQDSSHLAMLGLSLLPFFGGVCGFIAMVLWAVLRYPVKVSSASGVKFIKRFNFLFHRFAPSAYYFALILIVRNFLLGMLPVTLVGFSGLQFLSLSLTVLVYAILQARIWPWRTHTANLIDILFGIFLMMVILVGSIVLEVDGSVGVEVIQIIFMGASVFALVVTCIVTIMACYRIFWPNRIYGVFLSHHKLGAAVLARWFKMLLAEYTTSRVFLDSDDVSRLDAIINVTAWDSENVVVLMTGETLKRMWCAAEIASAWAASTNLVLVSCDGNGFTQELADSLSTMWTDEQQATLANAGLSIDMIKEAYEGLLQRQPVRLNRKGAKSRLHKQAVKDVVRQCRGLSTSVLARFAEQKSGSGLGDPAVVMVGDLNTPEAGSCCRVIQLLLQREVQEPVHVLDPEEAAEDPDHASELMANAKVILVVLTPGVLENHTFAGLMAGSSEKARAKFVPIKADEAFIYPDSAFWANLADGKVIPADTLRAMEMDLEDLRVAYARLFNVLALKFTSHSNESIQAVEIRVMAQRLESLISSSRGSTSRQISEAAAAEVAGAQEAKRISELLREIAW